MKKLTEPNPETFSPNVAPRSAYIHIPFCRHRCGYCNFALVANRDYLVDDFLKALATEVSWLDREFELDTLFFGGGTPSHLQPNQLVRLKSIVDSRFRLAPHCEVTSECNPNDLTVEKADALAQLGVNRISLGAQSLLPQKLKQLDRTHSQADVQKAIENARRFANSVSLDLIFSAPNETLDDWKRDLELAIQQRPDHISTYELTYEKGTKFWTRVSKGSLAPADEELRLGMYEHAIQFLDEHGWSQYEVSSFSRPQHQCRHNLIYWLGEPYFAFGPGAARFVDGFRETNHASTNRYVALVGRGEIPVVERSRLEGREAAKEFLWIGLRMTNGISVKSFSNKTGFEVADVLGELATRLVDQGLMEISDQVRLTRQGQLVADWIASEIIG